MTGYTAVSVKQFPRSLWLSFRSEATAHGLSVLEALQEALRLWLAERQDKAMMGEEYDGGLSK